VGGGGRGTKSFYREKAWASVNHSILSNSNLQHFEVICSIQHGRQSRASTELLYILVNHPVYKGIIGVGNASGMV
jgi:hypothetical protein